MIIDVIKGIEEAAESADGADIVDSDGNDMKLAAAYFTSGLVVTDNIERAKKTEPRMAVALGRTIDSVPCLEWCIDANKPLALMSEVSRSVSQTTSAFNSTMYDAASTCCKRCSNKLFDMAEALEYHLRAMHAKVRDDDKLVLACVRNRAIALRRLGVKRV